MVTILRIRSESVPQNVFFIFKLKEEFSPDLGPLILDAVVNQNTTSTLVMEVEL